MLDLWPDDIGNSDTKAPVAILREQAEILGIHTKNLLEGRVRSTNGYDRNIIFNTSDVFIHTFSIVAPALGDYEYDFFSIIHDIELYPLIIKVDDGLSSEFRLIDNEIHVVEEKDFIDKLKAVLGSKRTRKIISALLSQLPKLKNDEFKPPVNFNMDDIPF